MHCYTDFGCYWKVFVKVFDHLYIIEAMHREVKYGSNKRPNIKALLVGARVAHNLEVVVLSVGTLRVSFISIRVRLVSSFMQHLYINNGGQSSYIDYPGHSSG